MNGLTTCRSMRLLPGLVMARMAAYAVVQTEPFHDLYDLIDTVADKGRLFAAGWLEAAYRVVNGLDLRYPAWRDEVPSSLSDTPNLPSITPLAANDAA